MENLAFDTLSSSEYCDMGAVISFTKSSVVSTLGFNVTKDEVLVLSDAFEDNSKVKENGFTVGGADYCAIRYLPGEIYAKKKGDIEYGVVILKTKTCLAICHFKKTIHMSHCVVLLGQVKKILEGAEFGMKEEPVMEEYQVFLKKDFIVEEEEVEGEGVGQDLLGGNVKFLLKSGYCDFACICDPQGQVLASNKRVNPGKNELMKVIRAFEDASDILENGFEVGGSRYCCIQSSPGTIYAKEKGDKDKGLVCMETSGGEYVIVAHFENVTHQGNLSFVMEKAIKNLET